MPELLLDHTHQEYTSHLIEFSPSLPITIAHINEAAIEPIQPGTGDGLTVDLARFSAVKAHSGDMGTLLKEAEINGRPIGCPFLQSLGAKGIEMAQKWIAEDKNPNKNLSLDELLAQKKVQEQSAKPTVPSDHDAKIKANALEVPKYVQTHKEILAAPSPATADREPDSPHKSVLPDAMLIQAQQAVRLAIEQRATSNQLSDKLKPVTLQETVAPIIEATEAKHDPITASAKRSSETPPIQVLNASAAKLPLVDTAPRPPIEPAHEAAAEGITEPRLSGSAPKATSLELNTTQLPATHVKSKKAAANHSNPVAFTKSELQAPTISVRDLKEAVNYADQPEIMGILDPYPASKALVETAVTEVYAQPDFALWESELSNALEVFTDTEYSDTNNQEGFVSVQAGTYDSEFEAPFIAFEDDMEVSFTAQSSQMTAEDIFFQSDYLKVSAATEQPELIESIETETQELPGKTRPAVSLNSMLVRSFENPDEITTKVESLELQQTRVMTELYREILLTITKSLDQPSMHAEKADDKQELQQKCMELFTLIGLSYDDETVAQFVQNIRESLLTTNGTKSNSLLELSLSGTHEHKFRHKLSSISLIRTIQRIIQQQLRVGQYILRVS